MEGCLGPFWVYPDGMKVSLVAAWVVFFYLCAFATVAAFLAFLRFGDGLIEQGVWSLVSSLLWGSGAILWLGGVVWRWGRR